MKFMSRLHFWDVPTERKNLGFLFAIEHGAREVVDVISGEYLPGNHCLDDYIPVTYPTGLLWNPYPSMLGTKDLWPKGFPKVLRQGGTKEEVLNDICLLYFPMVFLSSMSEKLTLTKYQS